MANNLFIITTEGESGKSVVSLGIMEMLMRKIDRVAYFRPITQTSKKHLLSGNFNLINNHFKLGLQSEQMYAYTYDDARDLILNGKYDEFISGIVAKYKQLEENYDFVLCEGTDFESESSPFELDINSRIASLISSPVLLIKHAYERDINSVIHSLRLAIESFQNSGCDVIGTIVNRVPEDRTVTYLHRLTEDIDTDKQFISVLPESRLINSPTISEIQHYLDATIIYGKEQLSRQVSKFSLGNMHLENYLWGLSDGVMIITTGDRVDIILGAILANQSSNFPEIAGIILTIEHQLDNMVIQLIKGLLVSIPILVVRDNIISVVSRLDTMKSSIHPEDSRKIGTALSLFETHIDIESLSKKIVETKTDKVTPKMFEYGLIQKAKSLKQHIVLPEGNDDRILKAAEILTTRDMVKLTILGDKDKVNSRIYELGLKIPNIRIVDPEKSPLFDKYVKTFFEMRKSKGVTMEDAINTIKNVSYFGTMMVHMDDADGMVSGASHSTAQTIRPSLQIIKTLKGIPLVSSVFLMCLKDRILVFGDCAVNTNPSSEELAYIALSSAITARTFGIEPKVAMLSYSSGTSGSGEDVEKVREATKLVKEKNPQLKIEGPIQYDAAVSKSVARSKLPDSEVAGQASVFIFPDLNTGNNTYKAVQREAGTLAIGPILQGLNKPINDLSRGCLIADIINTVAITAIQAINRKKDLSNREVVE